MKKQCTLIMFGHLVAGKNYLDQRGGNPECMQNCASCFDSTSCDECVPNARLGKNCDGIASCECLQGFQSWGGRCISNECE